MWKYVHTADYGQVWFRVYPELGTFKEGQKRCPDAYGSEVTMAKMMHHHENHALLSISQKERLWIAGTKEGSPTGTYRWVDYMGNNYAMSSPYDNWSGPTSMPPAPTGHQQPDGDGMCSEFNRWWWNQAGTWNDYYCRTPTKPACECRCEQPDPVITTEMCDKCREFKTDAVWHDVHTADHGHVRYTVVDRAMSWTNAKRVCRDMFGYHVTIGKILHKEENDVASGISREPPQWMGGNNEHANGDTYWRWTDHTGTSYDMTHYDNWSNAGSTPPSPHNQPSGDGHCSELNRFTTYLGTWNDYKCKKRWPVLCECRCDQPREIKDPCDPLRPNDDQIIPVDDQVMDKCCPFIKDAYMHSNGYKTLTWQQFCDVDYRYYVSPVHLKMCCAQKRSCKIFKNEHIVQLSFPNPGSYNWLEACKCSDPQFGRPASVYSGTWPANEWITAASQDPNDDSTFTFPMECCCDFLRSKGKRSTSILSDDVSRLQTGFSKKKLWYKYCVPRPTNPFTVSEKPREEVVIKA
jgi:hypothetical protein